MLIENILRSARKANGEVTNKLSEKNSSNVLVSGQKEKKWYEKTWLICFMLIFFFPLGLIMLWLFGEYSVKAKSVVTLIIVLLLFIGYENNVSPGVSIRSYDVGYLKRGTAWEDEKGKAHYNSKSVKVEIWRQKIVMGDGSELIQIYFLEGENAGEWGYVRDIALQR